MKVLQINSVLYGSTGRIMLQIYELAQKNDINAYIAVPNGRHNKKQNKSNYLWIGNRFSEDLHLILSRLTGYNGYFSKGATRRFLKKIDEINPDIIHMHNLHNSYINLKELFRYIKKKNIRVVWSLHDCWSFTGKCPHFVMANCEMWKTGCYSCPQYRSYPQAFIDKSKQMYIQKKELFTGVKNLTIITPSKWLAGLVKQSFLKDYEVKVINNGIDLDVFSPTESKFRERYSLDNKKIILGVAFGWGRRKGLDIFIELSKRLNDDYRIVLVGTDDAVDLQLPENIISIHRTQNQKELAEIYSTADVFVNPTREDTYPTVNMESIACGTPIVTFNTGGSPEILDEKTGIVVDVDDIDALEKAIIEVTTTDKFTKEACIERAKAFKKEDKFKEYIDLYLS